MKLSEAWRLSQTCYREMVYRSLAEERGRMWWGAFGRNRQGKESQDDLELTKRALRIAKFDKGVVAFLQRHRFAGSLRFAASWKPRLRVNKRGFA